MKLNNKYYILRHGEAMSNAEDKVSSWPEKFDNHLTENGAAEIKKTAEELKNICAEPGRGINFIFASDLLRTKETAEIAENILGIKPEFDKRLREVDFGVFNGSPAKEFEEYFKGNSERLDKAAPDGENYRDIFKRISNFFDEINNKYKDKNILIISHQLPLFLLEGYAKGHSLTEITEEISHRNLLNTAELREIK